MSCLGLIRDSNTLACINDLSGDFLFNHHLEGVDPPLADTTYGSRTQVQRYSPTVLFRHIPLQGVCCLPLLRRSVPHLRHHAVRWLPTSLPPSLLPKRSTAPKLDRLPANSLQLHRRHCRHPQAINTLSNVRGDTDNRGPIRPRPATTRYRRSRTSLARSTRNWRMRMLLRNKYVWILSFVCSMIRVRSSIY